jgi:membrane protease YdiL (CAAX protease family)
VKKKMINMETTKTSPFGNLQQLMRRYPLVSYFILAYAFSWIITMPSLLSVWNVIPGDYTLGLMLKQWVGPAIAAIIMTRINEGKPGQQDLRQRVRQWRASWQWYLFIILGVPALILLGVIIQPGTLANFQGFPPSILVSYPLYFAVVFIGVGLPEEIGWRGFALPRMQQRFGPFWSSVILGILWSFWHLLYFLLPDHGGGPGTSFTAMITNIAIFTLMVMAITFIFTWVFNHTGGSVFIASLVHAAIDAPQLVWLPLFLEVGTSNSTTGETSLNLALLITFGAFAILVLILTRGRLGYQPAQAQPLGTEELKTQPVN